MNENKAAETAQDAAVEVLHKMKAKYNDAVEHPNHYTAGGIECIDAIRASLGLREFADYCKGNVLKYLWRYRLKNGVEDLKKAKVYLDWMIAAEEKSKGWGD